MSRRKVATTRISVTLDPTTAQQLRTRAKAHRISMSAYVRAAIIGARPGAGYGEIAQGADAWWDNLPPERRAGIHDWITAARRRRTTISDPDQLSILDALLEEVADA